MAKLLQMGHAFAAELGMEFGHIACTLGGVKYESRGGAGCVKGKNARGADHKLFRRRHHLVLTDDEAAAAKEYADACVGQPYDYPNVPTATRGGDCSGYMSGIICAAMDMRPRRLFTTANWLDELTGLGFEAGLGDLAALRVMEDDVNLNDVVYTAKADDPSGVPVGPRTVAAILRALDTRSSLMVATPFLLGRLTEILNKVSADASHPVTLTQAQITALAQRIAAELEQ
jgi:hypothetical protein